MTSSHNPTVDEELFDWIDKYGLCELMSYEADQFKKELKERITAAQTELLDTVDEKVIGIDEIALSPNGAHIKEGKLARNKLRKQQRERLARIRTKLTGEDKDNE